MTDPSLIPGAMERTIRRELPDGGLIEFEEAPVGWLGKGGTPRLAPWRAYFYTPAGGRRLRMPSSTTVLDAIMPKPGLPPWSEQRGIEGAVEAFRLGLVGTTDDAQQVVRAVRSNHLGADAAKNAAADRGLNVHAMLEEYLRTGHPPRLGDHPEAHRGFLTALALWLLHANPEPIEIEQIVVHPEDGYAGRLDLRATIGGRLVTVDAKTQENGAIYPGAHLQVGMYERAAVRCGAEPADSKLVVVFAANGEFREMPADHDDWRLDAALAYYRAIKPIDSACASANRAARKTREAVAA